MVWIRFFTGLLVIFFAGKRHSIYGQAYLSQSDIKSLWLRSFLRHLINAFPESCILFLSASIILNPSFNLALIWGIFVLNLVVLATALFIKREQVLVSLSPGFARMFQVSFFFLLGFSILYLLSLWPKIQARFFHLGWPSIGFLVGYLLYIHLFITEARQMSQTKPFEEDIKLKLPPMVLFLRFFMATLLIFAGAGQVVYGCKELISQIHCSPSFIGAFLLAPIACMPKLPALWQRDISLTSLTKRILEANILIAGFFIFWADVLFFKSDLYSTARGFHFCLALIAIFFIILSFLSIKMDLKKRRVFSSITILTYFLLFVYELVLN